jgi:hypothetical protein
VEKYGVAGRVTDDKTIRRMRIACWKNKAKNTFITNCFFAATMVIQKRLNVKLYAHRLSYSKMVREFYIDITVPWAGIAQSV